MTEIINLNKLRKLRKKRSERQKAVENRTRTGQKKPARQAARLEQKALARRLDGAKLPPGGTQTGEEI